MVVVVRYDRQIPYAIGQFTVNEFCHELAYRRLSEEQRLALGHGAQFGIDLGSGVVAGFAAAILSQVRTSISAQNLSLTGVYL